MMVAGPGRSGVKARRSPRGRRSRAASATGETLPIYQQVRDRIAAQIERGEYVPDQQLPSERDLSANLGVSRMTARHVYVTLQSDGLIYRANRRGWFVAPPRLHYALTRSVSFLANVRAEGGVPRAEVLRAEALPCPEWLGESLRLGRSDTILAIRRLLSIGNRPAVVEMLYMPADRFPNLLDQRMDQSVSQLWKDRYDVDVTRAEATIRGGMLPPEDAVELEMEPSMAGIRLVETLFDASGRPIAVDVQHWRGDIAEFSLEVDFTAGRPR